MGVFISKIFSKWSTKETRITMVGLDGAGKSTLLYKLKLGEVVPTIPTIGFQVETVRYKNIDMTVWDIGGQDKIRPLWRHYYKNVSAIIYVVDANDRERLDEARDELAHVLSEDDLNGVPVLVFANKQDLPRAMTSCEVADGLGLASLKTREWYIQGSNCLTGEGLLEGLEWLRTTTIAGA